MLDLYAIKPLIKKKSGIRNDINILFRKVGVVMPKEVISTWEKTTKIIVKPRKASIYSIRFVDEVADISHWIFNCVSIVF